MTKQDLQQRFGRLSGLLVAEMNSQGFWPGELSSSALGVAVALAALHFHDREGHAREIGLALDWLINNVNDDGSFGDSPGSPGNVSASLLVYAAVNLYAPGNQPVALLQQRVAAFLAGLGIDVHSPLVARFILNHYQQDYTFSVPILTLCGLCGVPGPGAFSLVPQLPFELALLPRRFYHLLRLSVVSYAIPALIAVGIVVFKKKPSYWLLRFIRRASVRPALKLLLRLMPPSGGFLEAIPLTAFVCLSLVEGGFRNELVVQQGIAFLKGTQRKDGSWPIDVDLSTWVSSLSVKALRGKLGEVLTGGQQLRLAAHFAAIQNTSVHPFNGSRPGGWGWTHFSGSVPDGDDTPGVMLALLRLQAKGEVMGQLHGACRWLLYLQNADGGLPTFSKGWGHLPFDRSCADLTGHGLLALSACLEAYADVWSPAFSAKLKRAVGRMALFLLRHRLPDGSFLPLWFGNQYSPGQANPVYGTARVVSYLNDALAHQWLEPGLRSQLQGMVNDGRQFLLVAQNNDGSWGGSIGVKGSIEETALAVSALASPAHAEVCARAMHWLDVYTDENGWKPAPVGLYFASLWYHEKLYPLTAHLEAVTRLLELE